MGKSYYSLNFFLFWWALLVCGVSRIYLKLFVVDLDTGFYAGNVILEPVFNITLGAVVVLLMIMNRLRVTYNDYPVVHEDQSMGVLALACGAGLGLFTLEQCGWLQLTANTGILIESHSIRFFGTQLVGYNIWLCAVLGILSALSFLVVGMREIMGRRRSSLNELIILLPAVWQLMIIVMKFNSYTTLTTISDNLLTVLFMVFAATFMIGNARTICNFARKDGRNYTLPTGLITALLGLLLTVPNYMYMAVNRTASPAVALGDMESIYILLLSFYALTSAVRLRRSIAFV